MNVVSSNLALSPCKTNAWEWYTTIVLWSDYFTVYALNDLSFDYY